MLVGTQADFDYDVIAELVFDDEAAFRAFFARVSEREVAERIAGDEERFLERGRLRGVVVGDCVVTMGE